MSDRISREDLFKWCSIPLEEIKKRDDLKTKLVVAPNSVDMMRTIGNMMADEVAANNAAGRPTKWVLPAGPTAEYDTFIERVNRDRISLKNLWVFHMDEFLDWQGRPYPVADTYESLEGTMNACFYGRIDEDLNVPVEQRIWPRINDIDYPDELCDRLGGVDTVWAGIGSRGFMAFCEEPRGYCYRVSIEEFAAGKTSIVNLNDDTIVTLSARSFGCCYDRIPPRAITLGYHILLSAKRMIYMVATGSWKETVVRVILFSEPTLEYPVTLIPAYVPDVTLYTTDETLDHTLSHEVRGW